jgi:hypothetical protein
MRGVGRGAERACGRDRAAFGDTAAGNCDATGAHGDASGQYGNASGQHCDTSGWYGDAADTAAGKRSGIEFAGAAHARKQYATFDGKSKYAKHAGDDAERVSLRAAAGNGGDSEELDAGAGRGDARNVVGIVESGFVEFGGGELRIIAFDGGQQRR